MDVIKTTVRPAVSRGLFLPATLRQTSRRRLDAESAKTLTASVKIIQPFFRGHYIPSLLGGDAGLVGRGQRCRLCGGMGILPMISHGSPAERGGCHAVARAGSRTFRAPLPTHQRGVTRRRDQALDPHRIQAGRVSPSRLNPSARLFARAEPRRRAFSQGPAGKCGRIKKSHREHFRPPMALVVVLPAVGQRSTCFPRRCCRPSLPVLPAHRPVWQ